MVTYLFRAILEPDGKAWTASAPALVAQGASTWGATPEEAMRNLEEVVRMVVDSLVEHGEAIPASPTDQVRRCAEPWIAVTPSLRTS